MGKSRGRGRGRGGGRGGRGRGGDDDDSSEEEYVRPERGQSSNVGMLPPSDSEDETDSEDDAPKKGQNPNVGALPPNSSSEEDSSSGSDSDGEAKPKSDKRVSFAPRLAVASEPRRKNKDEIDPAELAENMARLELVRKRREEQRLKRIAEEGWDRFAPISETNKPPGTDAALLAGAAAGDSS